MVFNVTPEMYALLSKRGMDDYERALCYWFDDEMAAYQMRNTIVPFNSMATLLLYLGSPDANRSLALAAWREVMQQMNQRFQELSTEEKKAYRIENFIIQHPL